MHVARLTQKLREDKPPTQTELAAMARTIREQQKSRDVPYFRKMPKGEFTDMFGGSSKVYIEWAEKHGFPWPEKERYVDAIEIMLWYRQQFADRDTKTKGEREFFDDWQGKCWEERYYELLDKREKRQEQLILREDFHLVLNIIIAELRQAGERLQRTYGADAQDVLNDAIDNIKHHAQAQFKDAKFSDDTAGHAQANGQP